MGLRYFYFLKRISAHPFSEMAEIRCFLSLVFYILILGGVKMQESTVWNGCVGTKELKMTDYCYTITLGMDGLSAWQHCVSVNFSDFVLSPSTAKSLLDQLMLPPTNGSDGSPVWVGGIEAYPGSGWFVGYRSSLPNPDTTYAGDPISEGRGCLALDPATGFRIVRKNCNELLPRLCIYKKFEMVIYDGSAEDACNVVGALASLQSCYNFTNDCNKGSYFFMRWNSGAKLNFPRVAELYMMITEGKTYERKENKIIPEGQLCFLSHGNNRIIRLELRHNKTAGGLTLWVSGKGRVAEWPPSCVGGRIKEGDDPRALRVILATETEATPVIWCYALDMITGAIAISNSVARETNYSCASPVKHLGPPPGTIPNERASCLRCLKSALSKCHGGDDCNLECYKGEGCSHFGINITNWHVDLKREGGLHELNECVKDDTCIDEAYWQLTEGGDCNDDGYVDCDDRFARIFDTGCGKDPRDFQVLGTRYWTCRTDPRRDFVDFVDGNTTARYYCVNNLNLGRHWSLPANLDEITPYAVQATNLSSPSTEPDHHLVSTLPSVSSRIPLSLEQVDTTLRILHSFTNKTIESQEEMKNIVKNFSKLLHASDTILQNALKEANIPSLSELLQTILINAPMDVSETTDNIAVSKNASIGFQLLSDGSSGRNGIFGKNPRQIPVTSESEITANGKKVEAAVIIPDLPRDVSLVMITFAKKEEFIPCRPQLMSNSKEPKSAKPYSSSSTNDDANSVNLNTPLELSEEFCPPTPGIVRGCINSPVVQVGLLRNGSYVQHGKHIDIKIRMAIYPSLYQRRQCVYWQTKKRGWAYDGCVLQKEEDGLATCRCKHRTHFAQLITDADALLGPDADYLHIITICCSVVSLTAFVSMLVTGAVVSKWRAKKENKVMLNLAAAFSLYLAMFLFCATSSKSPLTEEDVGSCTTPAHPSFTCLAKGIALHYLVLSSFWWMLVAATTHYLRLTTLQQIGIPRYILKSMLVGWGVPVLPVVLLIVVDLKAYGGTGRDFCYPTGNAFYGAVLVPVLVVFIANGSMFVLILRQLFPRCFPCCGDKRKMLLPNFTDTRKALLRKLVVCFAFTFLFGLTWYSALFSFSIVPAYFVSLSLGLQGPLLFFIFVLGEENIRSKLYSLCTRFKTSTMEQLSVKTLSVNETAT